MVHIILSFLTPALFVLPATLLGEPFLLSTIYIISVVTLFMFGYVMQLGGIADVWYLLGRFQIVICADIIGNIINYIHRMVFTGGKKMFYWPFFVKMNKKTYVGPQYCAMAWLYTFICFVLFIIYETTKFTGFMEYILFPLLLLTTLGGIVWLWQWSPTKGNKESRAEKIKTGFLGLVFIVLGLLIVVALSQFFIFVGIPLLGPNGERFWVQNIALTFCVLVIFCTVVVYSFYTRSQYRSKKLGRDSDDDRY